MLGMQGIFSQLTTLDINVDKNKLEIERLIHKMIIGMVHSESVRIADTCQREMIFLIRSRVPNNLNIKDLDLEGIKNQIKIISDEIASTPPESKNPRKRAVVRRSFLRRITFFLSDIWPFGE